MEKNKTQHQVLHQDLAVAQKLEDGKAVLLVHEWLDEMQPFDGTHEKNVLVSFLTGFLSTEVDNVNADKAVNIGKNIQIKVDGQVPTAKMETKCKVQPLAVLRNVATASHTNTQLNAMKFFNLLIISAQREANIENSLEYELTPLPMSSQ